MPFFDVENDLLRQQIQKRLQEIEATIYPDILPIGEWYSFKAGHGQGPREIPSNTGKNKVQWRHFRVGPGAVWGEEAFDVTVWFRTAVRIPQSMKGKTVALRLHPGGESLCYLNGKPDQGLDENRRIVRLVERAKGGERYAVVLESYNSAHWTPWSGHVRQFDQAELVTIDRTVWDFYWDLRVALETYQVLETNTSHSHRLIQLLAQAAALVEPNACGTPIYTEQIQKASRFLRKGLQSFQGSAGWGTITLTGHAHIDTAWLWPLRETRRKCARTFSSVLKYMETYPEYCFSQSQAQLYEFIKDHYPDIYAKIKKRVKEGRWEICGAGWVEEDNNIPSGESMIRQFLYGNRFYENEFGVRSRVAWLPDSFGYSWSLPQILLKCGIDYFVTNKISWCEYNKAFPYSLFWWQGVDGSRIFSYLPVLNYNGNVSPKDLRAQWESFRQKDLCDETGLSFGYGDGGGGPTVEMIETGRRLKNFVGVPKVQFGKTEPMLDRLYQSIDHKALPVWNGELYLEYHRGCQTTQARTKRFNRKLEAALHNAEFLSVWASRYRKPYPADELYAAWKTLLLNQFHDILPGSSIGEVYAVAEKMYAEACDTVAGVTDAALECLIDSIDTEGDGKPVVVLNSRSWLRTEAVEIALPTKFRNGDVAVVDGTGQRLPVQISGSGNERKLVFLARNVPPMGYATFWLRKAEKNSETVSPLTVNETAMENGYLRLRFDKKGQIVSIFDKWRNREIVPKGAKANVLRLYDDRPHEWDAWEVDYNYTDTSWDWDDLQQLEVVESGPVRAVLRVVRKTEKSTLIQDITLYRHTPRVDFVTHVDWHEKRRLLKAVFPVDVLSPRASYEIQFGAIERPTHHNTAYDRSKFEVPAHRWADLSETDYGVALLNDSKYGYGIQENVMTLSLLRSPVMPDPYADEGEHRFTYSILPHAGSWQTEGVVQAGLELNEPLLAVPVRAKKGKYPASDSLILTDAANVLVDTVKKAENGNATIIRLYEAIGRRGECQVTFNREPKAVAECNCVEEDDRPLRLNANQVNLNFHPFEIKTLKVVF